MKKIFLLVLVVALFGCGKKNQNSANIVKKNAVILITQDMDFLDPHKALAAGTSEVFFNVFEGLLKPTSSGKLVPAVAESYEVSKDKLKYTFVLRNNIKFHNDKLVTLDDIIYSFNRVKGDFPASATLKKAINNFSSIEKLSSNKIVFTLKKANPTILNTFTLAIIPKDVKDINKTPIGTGPFKFVKYLPGQYIDMIKFNNYWNPSLPKLEKVRFSIIKDEQSSLLALQRGEIDLYPRLPSTQIKSIEKLMPVATNEQNLVQMMAMNNKFKPFQDIRVRKAMAYAIDKRAIIDTIDDGRGHLVASAMSPIMVNFYNNQTENFYSYNIEKAKELLKEAGYENGFKFTLNLPSNYQFHTDAGIIIAEQLKKIGVEVKLNKVEWGTWLKDTYSNRNYDATVIAIDGKIEPFQVFSRYVSDAGNNFMNFNSSEYDKTLNIIQTAESENEVKTIYKKAQDILAKELPAVFIMAPSSNVALNNGIKGYTPYPIYVLDASTLNFEK